MIFTIESMEDLIRSELNETTQIPIASTEILNALNDGYKEVSSRALCIEREEDAVTVSGSSLIRFSGHKVKQVSVVSVGGADGFIDTPAVIFQDTDDVEWERYAEETFINIGIPCILPTNVGTTKLRSAYPRSWFPWGRYIYIQPVPNDRYRMKLYIADWPDAALVSSTDLLTDLPGEFHSCVVDFALYVLSIKLRRWGNVVSFYNRYINNLTRQKYEYIKRKIDERAMREEPDNVVEASNG